MFVVTECGGCCSRGYKSFDFSSVDHEDMETAIADYEGLKESYFYKLQAKRPKSGIVYVRIDGQWVDDTKLENTRTRRQRRAA